MRNRPAVRACLAALVWLLVWPAVLQAKTVPLPDYLAAVESALAHARASAGTSDTAAAAREMGRAADALRDIDAVTGPKGIALNVDNKELLHDLRDGYLTPADVVTRLASLRATLKTLPASDSTLDRAALADLLKRPPFVAPPPNPILRWLSDLIDAILGPLFRSTGIGRVLLIVLGAGVAGAVIYLAVRALRSASSAQSFFDPGNTEIDVPVTSQEAMTRAQTLAASGDLRSAVRQLYLATLLWLDERGALRFDKSLTNRETVRAVAKTGSPELAALLQPIVDIYDRVWYGFERIDVEHFEAYKARVDAVRAAPKTVHAAHEIKLEQPS